MTLRELAECVVEMGGYEDYEYEYEYEDNRPVGGHLLGPPSLVASSRS